jgi:hypothetical protein
MIPSKDLFELIKSMSQGEKTYFKKYSQLHTIGKENYYLLLFDAICKQKNYDESKVILKLKRYDFVQHFAVAKNYLYSRILDSLESYHKNMSVNATVRKYIQRIELLINKNLYSQALKIIEKAKNICVKYELFEEQQDLVKWHFKIAIAKEDILLRKKILAEAAESHKLFNNYRIYRELDNAVSSKYQLQGVARTPRELIELKKIISTDHLNDSDKARSIRSKFYFYGSRNFIALSTGDFDKIYRNSKNIVEILQANPHLIAVNAPSYIAFYGNMLIGLTGLKKYDEIYYYAKKFENERKKIIPLSDAAFAFTQTYHLLNYYTLTGKFTEAKEDLKKIEHEMKGCETSIRQSQRMVLYTGFAQIHFGQGNYKQCLNWLNKILLFGDLKRRTDIECFARIFSLVAYYEMKSDTDFMASKFKSVYRFLFKRKRMYQFESIMMDFIKENMLSKATKPNIKEQFIRLRLKLKKLYNDPFERQALESFDFISWLESKIEWKSFSDIIKEKTMKSIQ